MIDPRIVIIRLWLASVMSLALLFWCPWVAWIPLALMIPPLAESCIFCNNSEASPTYQVDVAGQVNGCCPCSSHNVSTVLTRDSDCIYTGGVHSGTCNASSCGTCNSNTYIGVQMFITQPANTLITISTHKCRYLLDTGTTTPNCLGFSGTNIPVDATFDHCGGVGLGCDCSGATATLTSL